MTISNKTSVFRVLCESLNELKRRPFVNTPQEKLARAQALFLFQIICVFDGDLTLRSNADRDMPLLQNWLDDLCKVRENVETSGDTNSTGLWKDPSAPRSWEVGSSNKNSFPILLPSLMIKVVDLQGVRPANHCHGLHLYRLMESNVQEQ